MKRHPEADEVKQYVGVGSRKAFAPHCDGRVLHSPGLCPYCDNYPDDQHKRLDNDIPFTDQLKDDEPLLPGEDRTAGSSRSWPGNRPEGYQIGGRPVPLEALHELSIRISGKKVECNCPDLINGHYRGCPYPKEV